ncbi:hypothetical protein AB0F52_09925 [Amycolatopsis sp. NPDC024027]|uniref:hypothetical protein n=1 Tax=Amycolatopsis sp. NPDC024027 TaxID=3154327 RepID=UPI0033C77BAA
MVDALGDAGQGIAPEGVDVGVLRADPDRVGEVAVAGLVGVAAAGDDVQRDGLVTRLAQGSQRYLAELLGNRQRHGEF